MQVVEKEREKLGQEREEVEREKKRIRIQVENIEGTKEKTSRIVEELMRMQDSQGDSLGQVGRVEDGDRVEVEGEVEIGVREPVDR